ncbi:hypothetical protein AN960_21025 [Bacillus sp. FJAT-25509]|uniref:SIR2 family protein n=1 Tax=Bacillus sp. FJAT-25509 TaxID=1712029 RepID=UPI0006FA635C|nr:SIR2 family protein [Bacillus sp. FJAT-25509]KQL33557.1 hypothetical protein AN960_21025 [Bacillus sp. FJAT-25509]
MSRDIELFIKDYSKEIEEDNAAVFAGAGLSVPVGYVSWSELLEPIADEIGLDIHKETDLVSLAQYYCNENLGNRSRINQIIMNEFSKKTTLTENHKILSRLPIRTYWTTNYDRLLENALENEGKVPDVKYTVNQLAITRPNRDAVIYKMHGDINHPNDAVIIKDDYESYFLKMSSYITALSGDLVSKTFLFLGFSFTDPNLDYVLSRIRSTYTNNQRRHYCIMKKIEIRNNELVEDFQYRQRKQELFINDLKRFNIKTLIIDSYDEITYILKKIENKIKRKTIFLSGSATIYNQWEKEESESFIHKLSKEIIKNKFNIVSGFGLGVGSFVITGALEEIYINQGKIDDNRLILRPFPQSEHGQTQWKKYREDMISRAGVSIFIYGNKYEENRIVSAGGVISEFEISHQQQNFLIPVGATGFAAKDLWNRVNNDFEKYYPNTTTDIRKAFDSLNDEKLSKDELIEKILIFLNLILK